MSQADLDLSSILSNHETWLDLWSDPKDFGWDRDEPMLVTPRPSTPGTCSTSQQMVPGRPTYAWDTNGWYRILGIEWPYVNATSGQLSKAYVTTGGAESARATYCLKMLLKRDVRAIYDLTPLGQVCMLDEQVQKDLKDRAVRESLRRGLAGEVVTPEDILSEQGFGLEPDDQESLPGDGDSGRNTPPGQSLVWQYGYWVWGSHLDAAPAERLMRAWQELLVSHLARQGHVLNLGVGIVGQKFSEGLAVRVRDVDGAIVAFLHEDLIPGAHEVAQASAKIIELSTR